MTLNLRLLFAALLLVPPVALSASNQVAVTDCLQSLPPGSVRLSGYIQDRIQLQAGISFDEKTLAAMADVFRKRRNGFADGEFWGKCVRALCHHYQYSADPNLRNLLDKTLDDLISTQTPDGAISGHGPERQPYDTDLWDRKYVLLGLINGYESTHNSKVLDAAKRMADHLLTQVGPPPKVRVFDTHYGSRPNFPQKPTLREICFAGIESSSILEPMVRLYRLTGEQRYLDFCRYLVEVEGGSLRGSIFEAALAGGDAKDFGGDGDPQHSVAHAYSVISCFEGLVEYYRATGEPRWKDSSLKFHDNVLAKETAIIGSSCGLGGVNNGIAPTEQFNYTAFHQTCPVRDGLEGCTHARWMSYCRHLLLLTGDTTFADQFEWTLYNAFLGSIRPDGKAVDYHTHLNGTRPARVNYHKVFNGKDISCCYFNVTDTLALIPFTAVMSGEGGPVVNLFIPGTASVKLANSNEVMLEQTTDYPTSGEISIKVNPGKQAHFPVRVRIPGWSSNTIVKINGEPVTAKPGTYLCMDRDWSAGDTIELSLDMRCRVVRPPEGTPEKATNFQALVRGPLVLARDKRLGGDVHEEVDIATDAEGYVTVTPLSSTIPARFQCAVPTTGGGSFPVIDFETSGNTWDAQSERVTWIPRHGPPTARWIWFPDLGNPAEHAQVGKRWFRRIVEIPEGREIKLATVTMSADNAFTLFVNGRPVGTGTNWQHPVNMHLQSDLKSGPVVLAVEVVNSPYRGPNAAGLIGMMQIEFMQGPPMALFTDGTWKTSDHETPGWQTSGFTDDNWVPARILGRNGMKPWGDLKDFDHKP